MKFSIAYIEDNPGDVRLTNTALKEIKQQHFAKWEFELTLFHNGLNAEEYFFDSENNNFIRPNMIFLDLNVPQRSGFDLLRTLREKEETKFLPVVIITTSNNESEVQRAYNLGATSYFVKPVDYEDYIALLTLILQYWIANKTAL